ncbi:MAG: FAD-dependent oxidoreductase [Ramlibacter sp.]|nr:FAD-dependent oxidoreductase [Ramlibacter sp.]
MKPLAVTRRAVLAGAAAPLLGCEPAPPVEGGFAGVSVERGHVLREGRTWPAPSVTRRTEVLIAGGGVAGLAAARALRQRGVEEFALLELEDSAGGNSRGMQVNGLPCPIGAHYLPLPGDDAREVQDLLEELGLRRRVAGRWQYEERHLCHSPQERLFFHGRWQEGLLPVQDVNATTLAQYHHFAQKVAGLQRASRFSMPALRTPFTPVHAALDALTMAQWLAQEGLDDPHLLWYLDYCCRDDYGAGLTTVSAWAGVHYFASRHGFQAPGDAVSDREAVLTWPEGNAWLTRRLAAPLGERVVAARIVVRIAQLRHGVQVDAWDPVRQTLERWEARQCIVALPLFVAARVVENPPPWLEALAARQRHAPWVVANLHLRGPLLDHPGAPPSWDNVVYGSAGLGYVDATHQRLDPRPGPTVLTWYRALGDVPGARQQLLQRPWTAWREEALAQIGVPHPDLPGLVTRVEVTRHGHAMAVPTPGLQKQMRLQPLSGGHHALSKKEQITPSTGRLHFAHADWSGYSVFEEAFTRGHLAGRL